MLEGDGRAHDGRGVAKVSEGADPGGERGDPRAVRAAVERLAGATERLRSRPVLEIVEAVGRAGERFGAAGDPLRERALSELPASAGLSAPMARAVLDGMARDWSVAALRKLVDAEFDDPAVLDRFATVRGRSVTAVGPRLCVQILAGTVPGVGVGALIRGLLVKAPTLIKTGRGDGLLPVLFAEALARDAPWLADGLEVTSWSSADVVSTAEALRAAEVVVVYGSDDTVRAVRAAAPATSRVIAHHHRFGVGAVGQAALRPDEIEQTASDVAFASSMFDQRGCVSPQIVFVEDGDVPIETFASYLAAAMERLESGLPPGPRDAATSAALRQLRNTAELVSNAGGGVVLDGGDDGDWTVAVERRGSAPLPAAGRVVRLRAFAGLAELARELERWGGHLQTMGLTGFGALEEEVALRCGRVGVVRIVGFRDVPFPAPEWYHDGRAPLRELVRWVERARG